MFNDIQKHSSFKPSTIIDADPIKQNHQIHLAIIQCSKRQMGLHSEELRVTQKNQHLPTHNLCLDQTVMYQDPTNKKWYPAKITNYVMNPEVTSYAQKMEHSTERH